MVKRKKFKITDEKTILKYSRKYKIKPYLGYKINKVSNGNIANDSILFNYTKRKPLKLQIKEGSKIFKYYGSYTNKDKVDEVIKNIKNNGKHYRIKKTKSLITLYVM